MLRSSHSSFAPAEAPATAELATLARDLRPGKQWSP